mgnify:CR=1 FL=1
MGTLSKIYVKNDNIDNIINEFKTEPVRKVLKC